MRVCVCACVDGWVANTCVLVRVCVCVCVHFCVLVCVRVRRREQAMDRLSYKVGFITT